MQELLRREDMDFIDEHRWQAAIRNARYNQFTSQIFQEYCKDIDTQLCFASVAHPRSNGQVERANTEILRGLKTRTYDCLKIMVQIGSASSHPCYGGTRPHPTEL